MSIPNSDSIPWKEHRRPRWKEGGREEHDADRAWEAAHPGYAYIHFSRCRSGRRWFWTAYRLEGNDFVNRDGWEDSEELAMTAARKACVELAAGEAVIAVYSVRPASQRLKEINAERRRARPAPDTSDAHLTEYLYGGHYGSYRFRITRKTKSACSTCATVNRSMTGANRGPVLAPAKTM
jgi:hypothetical protein